MTRTHIWDIGMKKAGGLHLVPMRQEEVKEDTQEDPCRVVREAGGSTT